jgi:ribosomal protein L18E
MSSVDLCGLTSKERHKLKVAAEHTDKSADTKMANLGGAFKIIRNVIFVTCAVLPGNYIQSHALKLKAGE